MPKPTLDRARRRLDFIRKNAETGVSLRPREPVVLTGGFHLRDDGMDVKGRPSIDDYVHAGDFILWSEHASPFWLADWLNYGDSRPEWREKIEQHVNYGLRNPETMERYKRTAHNVPRARRRMGLSFPHHQAVESLSAADQTRVLEKAETEGLNLNETRREVQLIKRRKVIEGQAVLEGTYRVLYVDPPWSYGNRPPSGKGAASHYPTMTIEAMCKLPVPAHTALNAVMFLWVTAPLLLQNPGPREVIEAWGFIPKTGIVWDKVRHNFGNYVSVRHEHLIICTRGRCLPDRPTPMPDSVVTERAEGEHSSKPETFRKLIEQLYDGPYLELFAREKPPGSWVGMGNDARLWANHVGEDEPVTQPMEAGV